MSTTREKLSVGGLPLNSGSFQEYLGDLSPSFWLPLGASNGLTDLSGNGYNGTANGGVTVGGGAGMLTGVSDTSTDFDGSNDYISTTYTTRRNLVENPGFEVDVSRWTPYTGGWTGASLTRSTAWASSGVASGRTVGTKDNSATTRFLGPETATPYMPVVALTVYSAIAKLNVVDAGGQGVNLDINWWTSGGVFISTSSAAFQTGTGLKTISVSAAAPATAALASLSILAKSSTALDTVDFHVDDVMLEAAASPGDYFDGAGYVSGGSYIADPGGKVGWLGTAHASASDKGAFANGTVRGMGAPLRVDSLAAVRGLIGSATNGLWVNTDGSLNLRIAGTDVTGNAGDLTAASTAFVWAEFDEPNDTVRFYVNGVLVDTVTGVTAQWAAESLDVGRARGIYQDGLMQHVAVVEGALTAAQIQALYEVGAEGQYTIQGLNIGPPSKRLLWQARKDGDALGDVPGYERRTVTAKIRVPGATDKDEALDRLGRLVEKLQLAEQVEGGIDAVWQPAGGTFTGTLKVLAAEITELPIEMTGDNAGWFIEHPVAEIRLDCKPFLYGSEVTVTTVTNTNPHQELAITDVPGDVPAEGRLIVTDAATQERDHVEWGWHSGTTTQTTTTLLLDSASLTLTGYSGTANTRTGAYSASGVVRGSTASAWTILASTGNQTHVGTYRVKARLFTTIADTSVRFTWRAGDASNTANPSTTPHLANQWVEVDLGTVHIPEAVLGTQRWDGRVEFKSATPAATFDLDYLLLIPAEGYGVARAPLSLNAPGVYTAYDDYLQTDGALAGKSAQVGGAYTGAGDADDFAVTNGWAQRSALSDTAPRINTLNVNLTAVHSGVRVQFWNASLTPYLGMVTRYVDASNYLVIRLWANAVGEGQSTLTLNKIIAGASTQLLTQTVYTSKDLWHDFALSVTAAGNWIAYFSSGGRTPAPVGYGQDSVLATAGTLATGDVGLYDYHPLTGIVGRVYDGLYAYAIPNDAVIYSGRAMEFRSDDTLRQDSAGTVYGRPPVYRGSRVFIPQAGDEDKVSRIVVKARRQDIATLGDDYIADSTSVAVAYTPRYLVIPRS